MTPNVRQAFVMRLIDDAMTAAGYTPTKPMVDGSVLYWPLRGTETIRILVTPADHRTLTRDGYEILLEPMAVAQRAIDAAFADYQRVAA
jgi:hypothetical protein